MTRHLHIFALAALSAALACDGDLPREAQLSIRIAADSPEDEVLRGCQSSLCQDYAMDCGATLMLRVSDPDTGEVLQNSGEPLLRCIAVAPANDGLCSLRNLGTELELAVPALDMRVEVALWNPNQLGVGDCRQLLSELSPYELFDAHGRPQRSFLGDPDMVPALGGAEYFRAGQNEDLQIRLDCHNQARLRECSLVPTTLIRATARDITTLLPLRPEQARLVTVRVGEVRNDSANPEMPRYLLDQLEPIPLVSDVAPPLYETTLERRFGDEVCTASLEDTPQATSSAHCEAVQTNADTIELAPLHLPKSTLSAILNALNLDSFPPAGLVVGRVVDESFSPAPGVVVTPSEGSLVYLSDDLSTADALFTSDSAYFVSTDVPYGTNFTAAHFDGRRHTGSPNAGLIEGKVTTLLIQLSGDVVGP